MHRSSSKTWLWVLGTGVPLIAILLLGLVLALRWATHEPLCQGKPVRVWVDEIARASYGRRDLAEEQLQTAGPAAVSAIIEALRTDQKLLRNRINDWWTKLWPKLPTGVRQMVPRPRLYFRPDRRMWISSLGRLGPHDQRVVAALTRELNSGDSEVRFFATHTLGEVSVNWSDVPATQQQIIRALDRMLTDSAFNVRAGAAYGLAKCGVAAQPCIPDLIQMLRDPDELAQSAAVRAISYIGGDAEVILPAIMPLLQSTGALTRAFAAYTLCHVTGDMGRYLPALIETLAAQDDSARAVAAALIGRLGKSATKALPDLDQALQDHDYGVRISAAKAIWRVSGNASASVPVLRRLLTVGGRGEQIEITGLLTDFGPDAAPVIPELMAALDNPDFLIRRNAARAIASIGPAAKDALPRLQALSKDDPFPSIRKAAVEAVGQLSKQ